MKTLTDADLKWLGVDLDKTLAHSEAPTFELLEPLPGAVEAMQELDKRGWKIVIYTARHWSDYMAIEEWCDKHGIPARRILCGKPLFKWMIDDRNIEFAGNWQSVLEKVNTPEN